MLLSIFSVVLAEDSLRSGDEESVCPQNSVFLKELGCVCNEGFRMVDSVCSPLPVYIDTVYPARFMITGGGNITVTLSNRVPEFTNITALFGSALSHCSGNGIQFKCPIPPHEKGFVYLDFMISGHPNITKSLVAEYFIPHNMEKWDSFSNTLYVMSLVSSIILILYTCWTCSRISKYIKAADESRLQL